MEVWLDEPGELRVALRTDDLRNVPGKRGSTQRPQTVTLATAAGARAPAPAGTGSGSASARRRRACCGARGAPTCRLVVVVKLGSGVRQVETRRVRLR